MRPRKGRGGRGGARAVGKGGQGHTPASKGVSSLARQAPQAEAIELPLLHRVTALSTLIVYGAFPCIPRTLLVSCVQHKHEAKSYAVTQRSGRNSRSA